ncbi:MAG: MarR family winged helix-turn-helix transcriptional regulator [Clostridia bacterium]|nr:MarR family winged helix-turn-helix transcriptional regulator [Clostridia bacterium]
MLNTENQNRFFEVSKLYNKLSQKCFHKDKKFASFALFAEALNHYEFISQQKLSDFVGCNKAYTCRTLFKMQLSGYLQPIIAKKPIALTEKGKEFAVNVENERKRLQAKVFEGITKEEDETLKRVVDKIISNMNKLD